MPHGRTIAKTPIEPYVQMIPRSFRNFPYALSIQVTPSTLQLCIQEFCYASFIYSRLGLDPYKRCQLHPRRLLSTTECGGPISGLLSRPRHLIWSHQGLLRTFAEKGPRKKCDADLTVLLPSTIREAYSGSARPSPSAVSDDLLCDVPAPSKEALRALSP